MHTHLNKYKQTHIHTHTDKYIYTDGDGLSKSKMWHSLLTHNFTLFLLALKLRVNGQRGKGPLAIRHYGKLAITHNQSQMKAKSNSNPDGFFHRREKL